LGPLVSPLSSLRFWEIHLVVISLRDLGKLNRSILRAFCSENV